MVESKILLYNVLAGIITGFVVSIVLYFSPLERFNEFVYQLTLKQLIINGVPSDQAARIANETLSMLKNIEWIYPLGSILNMFFLSIILGIIHDYIIRKTSMKPALASIITGLILLLVFQIIPLMLVSVLFGNWFLELYSEYIGFHIQIIMTLIYTAFLVIFTSFKGPWSKLLESKPRIY
ncbi:MAG: hypothetical protein J7L82_01460 [Staphylothermus sp.]|nr:hypothetical protein [Staphylothermus sp.]